MTIRAAIYVRPSRAIPQTAEEQSRRLRQIATDHGWTVVAALHDAGVISGKVGGRRPGLAALLHGVDAGAYEVVIIHSIHLVGRSLPELVALLAAIKAANVRLVTSVEGIDTCDADGQGLLDVAALLDAHVRFGRRERILAGQRRARRDGIRFGRPTVAEHKVRRVKEALNAGMSIREAGRTSGVSPSSVLRVRDDMRAAGPIAGIGSG